MDVQVGADGQSPSSVGMSSVTSPLPSLIPEVHKVRRAMDSPPVDDAPNGSPLAPAASPDPESPKRDQSSPVMLATMTPVSVIEYEEQEAAAAAAANQKTVIYVPANHQGNQDVVYGTPPESLETSNGPVSVVVQPPGSQLINQTATYQGPPGTTVLVLSELVEDMSPFLAGQLR